MSANISSRSRESLSISPNATVARRSLFEDKSLAKTSLKKDAAVINELKDILYAEKKRSILVVLQGMDTAGKSGTIKSVFARHHAARHGSESVQGPQLKRTGAGLSLAGP
jgi:polyphosphate kinase 2 (PPK2 family)